MREGAHQHDETVDEGAVRLASNRLYGRVAAIYALWVRIGSLGAFPRLYRDGCAALKLRPGMTVLDMCCGTGELFSHLHAAVTQTGRIVGCDLSGAMLRRARQRVDLNGWRNVDLVECDARDFVPSYPVDAAIFSICLSAIPWREAVVDHVLDQLGAGARVVVVDSLCVHERPGHRLANAYNRLKGRVIGADPDCGLADFLSRRLDGIERRNHKLH